MKKIVINRVDETIYKEVLDNGMEVYFYVNKNIHNNYVTFTTKYGSVYNEFEDEPRHITTRLSVHINDLQYEKDVLQWYVEMNEGGTPHTQEEIDKVKKMIEEME